MGTSYLLISTEPKRFQTGRYIKVAGGKTPAKCQGSRRIPVTAAPIPGRPVNEFASQRCAERQLRRSSMSSTRNCTGDSARSRRCRFAPADHVEVGGDGVRPSVLPVSSASTRHAKWAVMNAIRRARRLALDG
jgi:hypothetical protein